MKTKKDEQAFEKWAFTKVNGVAPITDSYAEAIGKQAFEAGAKHGRVDFYDSLMERTRQLEAFLREIKNELSPYTHEDAILDVNVRIREILGE